MADKVLPSNRYELGHSFLNAMWIAGFLATLQMVAVATAVLKREPAPDHPVVSTMAPLRVPEDVDLFPGIETPSLPSPVAVKSSNGNPEPVIPEISSGNSGSLVRKMSAPDLSGISDPVSEIKDPLLSRLVDSGVDDRRRGNLKGALEAFLDVYKNFPDHPRVLSEIAGTYGEMGNLELATKYWKQVAEMGAITAGPYFRIATKALQGEDPSIPELEEGKVMRLGKLQLKKTPVRADGEWVSLTIQIVGKANQPLTVGEMDLRVYFYDLINGETPGQTTAKITPSFPSQPYNWKENGTESVEVIYHQPVFTVEQKQNLGERVYFGYVIELYYQNQLQDSVVSSDELRSLRFPASEPVEEPPPPLGPDTSLFPINR